MTRALLVSFAIPSLLACAAAHDPEPPIASGIYALTIHSESDACTPRRTAGDLGRVSVVSLEHAVSIAVPENADDLTADVTRRVTLTAEDGFHAEQSDTMDACPAATTARTLTLTARDTDRFAIELTEQFTGLAACGPMDGMPSADCVSTRALDYELVSACEAPCELSWSAAGGITCACR
jgi:hypothetical protein